MTSALDKIEAIYDAIDRLVKLIPREAYDNIGLEVGCIKADIEDLLEPIDIKEIKAAISADPINMEVIETLREAATLLLNIVEGTEDD